MDSKPEVKKEKRMSGGPSMEMPRYKCHKEVWALKIAVVIPDEEGGGAAIAPVEEGYGPVFVSAEYVEKHKPQAGGYYVVYKDGYKSFSPAKAFEDGYALV